MSVLHPVAANAEAALSAPLGRAARAREATTLAGGAVEFVTEAVGPAFETREAALDAYAGRVEDDRPGRAGVAAEDRWCALLQMSVARRPTSPLRPTLENGRRWPEPLEPPRTVWRLSVSYWRALDAAGEPPPDLDQARRLRRATRAAELDAAALRRLAMQPLRPAQPQRALDLGLFDHRLPENPAVVVADE
jgi:hypothetical protein